MNFTRIPGILLVGVLVLSGCDTSINSSIVVPDGESRSGPLTSVNGDVSIGKDCTIEGTSRSVNGSVKVEELICDGVLVATAAGSTAYNLSVQGSILPLGTEAVSLTPISPFRPRRWKGAVLPSSARIRFEIMENYKRPVSATADAHEVRNVVSVDVFEDRDITLKLMFDPEHSLEDRILDEQFL